MVNNYVLFPKISLTNVLSKCFKCLHQIAFELKYIDKISTIDIGLTYL
jgi:hypothetical protein